MHCRAALEMFGYGSSEKSERRPLVFVGTQRSPPPPLPEKTHSWGVRACQRRTDSPCTPPHSGLTRM